MGGGTHTPTHFTGVDEIPCKPVPFRSLASRAGSEDGSGPSPTPELKSLTASCELLTRELVIYRAAAGVHSACYRR